MNCHNKATLRVHRLLRVYFASAQTILCGCAGRLHFAGAQPTLCGCTSILCGCADYYILRVRRLYWPCSEFSEYAEPTEIYYVVERRCPPSKNWLEIATDVKDTTYIMKEYRPEKDYMFRIRAGNEYGVSDPSMSSTLFSKIGQSE